MIPRKLDWKDIEISKIKPYKNNPKMHTTTQVELVARSLSEYGWTQPICVDKHYTLIFGHCRLDAAKQLGEEFVPAVFREDLSAAQVKALRILDNKSNESAWNTELLEVELTELQGLDYELADVGFDLAGLDDIRSASVKYDVKEDDFDIDGVLVEEPLSKTGDLWLLGQHRVLCSDCTVKENVERLMDGHEAVLLFTSPPYLNMREYGNIINLDIEYVVEFISAFSAYCDYLVINLGLKFEDGEVIQYWNKYIEKAQKEGLKLLGWNIWDKVSSGSIASQVNMFTITHEFLFVFGEQRKRLHRTIENNMTGYMQRYGKDVLKTGKISYVRGEGDVLHPTTSKIHKYHQLHSVLQQTAEHTSIRSEHPACYPIGLPFAYIEAMTELNTFVCDPFLGSGTTLIAADQLNRYCFGMENSPVYTDVIVKRFIKYKGTDAEVFLERDGKKISYSEVR